MGVAVVVVNPKAKSRTLEAAVRGLYLLDSAFTDPAVLDPWLAVAKRFVPATAPAPEGALA
jgi:hypothetical protein